MYVTTTFREKLKLFSFILVPILITQVSMYLMNFFDTIMSGRVAAIDLAGVAIGSSLWVPIFTGVNGILLAITPIIAQLTGAKNTDEVPNRVQQAIYLSVILAFIILIIGMFTLNPILNMMDLEAEVRHVAKYYLITLITGIIPLFIFNTLRCFIDALGKTRISMFIILISLPINIVFNYIFIFGKLGVPAFGGVGAGIATAITYWIVCILAIIIVIRVSPFKPYRIFANFVKPQVTAWWEQLKIGVPIGLSIFFETSIFSAVTLLMSVYSTYTIAAHQAAMNFASLLYMLPLSIGMALTITVAFEVGAKRHHDAKVYSVIGIYSGLIIAIFAGIILYVFDDSVARLYNTNPEVVALTKQFIYYAIFYQFADAIGAPIQGVLRAYKDVNVTLITSLVSFWAVGLPLGYILANYTALEPFGYWVGIIAGLFSGAIALLSRLLYVQKKVRHVVEVNK
ncbi:MATE family efflux transporter [Virgibacillus soli]|uniref:MATE family efflux transporter n=1 Tax=Paracerasibacillus soli TaxID=480284 RepID=UPI0035E47317